MKALKYITLIAALSGALTLSASATFIIDTDPGGEKLFINGANKDVSDFGGTVGKNNSGPQVAIHTMGNVDTGNGFSNIKPTNKNTLLTDLTFTPEDPNLFADFSFRGQLNDAAGGTVTVEVTDNLGGTQSFTFTGLGQNADFARQGIISVDGETIASITLMSDFKEVKQIEFSFAPGIPDSGSTVMLLGVALGGAEVLRRLVLKKRPAKF
jgi:hypothetical protein